MANTKNKASRDNKSRITNHGKTSAIKITKLDSGVLLLLISAVILILIFFGLILISFGVFENVENVEKISIEDKCSLVMGNLIHQIRDFGDCHVRCINECGILKLELESIEFLEKNNSCNSCDCSCK